MRRRTRVVVVVSRWEEAVGGRLFSLRCAAFNSRRFAKCGIAHLWFGRSGETSSAKDQLDSVRVCLCLCVCVSACRCVGVSVSYPLCLLFSCLLLCLFHAPSPGKPACL